MVSVRRIGSSPASMAGWAGFFEKRRHGMTLVCLRIGNFRGSCSYFLCCCSSRFCEERMQLGSGGSLEFAIYLCCLKLFLCLCVGRI